MKVRRSQYTADGVWVWTPSIGCGPNARSAFQSRRLYLRTFSRCTSCIELVSVGARVTTLVSLWIELWTCRVQLLLPPQPQTYSGSEVRRRAQLIGKPVPHRPTILELHSILVDIGTGWAQRCGLECQHRCSSTISSRRGGSWGKRRLSVGGWSSPFLSSPLLPLPQSSSLPRLHTASASSFFHIRCNKYRKMFNSWFETWLQLQNIYNVLTLLMTLVSRTKGSKLAGCKGGESGLGNTFGWRRMEVVGSIGSLVFLFSLCFATFIEALQTIFHNEHLDTMHHSDWIMIALGGQVSWWVVKIETPSFANRSKPQRFRMGEHAEWDLSIYSYGQYLQICSKK